MNDDDLEELGKDFAKFWSVTYTWIMNWECELFLNFWNQIKVNIWKIYRGESTYDILRYTSISASIDLNTPVAFSITNPYPHNSHLKNASYIFKFFRFVTWIQCCNIYLLTREDFWASDCGGQGKGTRVNTNIE